MKKFTLFLLALSIAMVGFSQKQTGKTSLNKASVDKTLMDSPIQRTGHKTNKADGIKPSVAKIVTGPEFQINSQKSVNTATTGITKAKINYSTLTAKTSPGTAFITKAPKASMVAQGAQPLGKVFWKSSGAKVNYLTQGFEGTWLPSGWAQTIVITTKTWVQDSTDFYTIDPASVLSAICPYSLPGETQNEWLKTPSITGTSGASSLVLKFWAGYSYTYLPAGGGGNPGATLQCKISTDGGSTWTLLWDANNTPSFSGWVWREISLDISAYKSTPFMLAWQVSGADGDLMALDNISVAEPLAVDAGVAEITSPVSSCSALSSSENVVVKIKNYGTSAISGFPVSYRINYGTPVTVTYTSSIAGGDSATYTFTGANAANLSAPGNYLIEAYTAVSGDANLANDTAAAYLFSGADNVPMTMGFENTDNLLGWTLLDANSDGYFWQIFSGATYAHTGTNFAGYHWNSSSAADDWLFSKCLNLNAGQTYNLQFYYRAMDASYPEAMNVNIGTTNDAAGMTTQLVDLPSISNVTYQASLTSFSVPATGTYYLGFHCKSAADMYYLLLDDISVTSGPVPDGGVAQITAPASSCTPLSAAENIVVKIKNYGTTALTGFPVSYQINNNTPVTATFTSTIAVGDSATFTFTGANAANLSAPGDYIIFAYTAITNDVDLSNDTAAIAIHSGAATLPYSMGFEDNEFLTGWSLVDANADGYPWGIYTGTTYSHTGTNFAAYVYNPDSAANDWLFTKCINMIPGNTYKLDFYYSGMGALYPESMDVYIGMSPDITSMATTLVDLPTISNDYYMLSSNTFTVPFSGNYYIGFHCKSAADMYYLLLDDISVTIVPPYDGEVSEIIAPVSSCSALSSAENVTINIINNGANALTGFPVSYQINNNTPVTATYTSSIAPGDTGTYTFTGANAANLSVPGDYIIMAYTGISGDGDLTNDTAIIYIHSGAASIPYTMGFEDSEFLTGWMLDDANTDGYTWGIFTGAVYAHTGNNFALYGYNTDSSANDWLFTKCISMVAGTPYQLDFYYRAMSNAYPEAMDVFIGTTNNVPGMTTLLTDLTSISDTNYLMSTTPFTVTTTGNYYIGFHCKSAADMWNLLLDDIAITAVGGTGHNISGKTRYAGKANNGSPAPNPPTYNAVMYNIDNVIVILKNNPGGTEVARDTSDASGVFLFTNVADGNYILSYDKYTPDTMLWANDVNAIDLAITKYYVGADTLVDPSRNFSAKYKKAANVDNNTAINAIDLSRIKAKIGSPLNASKNFPKGNWVALDTGITVAGADLNITLKTISYGDFNASSTRYRDSLVNWNTTKVLPQNIITVADDYVTTSDPSYFEVPLRISTGMNEFSALGLELNYPHKDFRLVSASMPKTGNKNMNKINPTLEEIIAEDNDLLVTDENGVIRVVFATTNHFDVASDDEMIILGFISNKTMNSGELDFSLSGTGVIGNQYGEENTDAYLTMPKIFVQNNNDGDLEFSAYPNPFGREATLTYNLPENGTVKIKVYNTIGELVTELVNESQAAGKHTFEFPAGKLSGGMFTFKLEFTGTDVSKCQILKLISK
ncbi:MAG TPA: choice-of-anchor J domain-containing protein [Bacteroidales bacterium]|nr:choice-of-anchor J domain-containing protein [Bacteroidales bacterium]